MRLRHIDNRPLPVRLAEAELDLKLAECALRDAERRMFEAAKDDDLDALDIERDEALRLLDWRRMRRDLFHDEATEHLVPEEHRLHRAAA